MAINNTTGSINTGNDCTIVLSSPSGAQLQLTNTTGFTSKQMTTNISAKLMNGNKITGKLPNGWQGTITMERGDHAVDDFIAQTESDWYSTGILDGLTLMQYIEETDGSTSAFQFDNVALDLSEAGSWAGDANVKVTLSWEANRREKV